MSLLSRSTRVGASGSVVDELPQDLKSFLAEGRAPDRPAVEQESAGCCSTTKQETCCEPSEKDSCCGSDATKAGTCGCQ